MLIISYLITDYGKIGKELIDSEVLVNNNLVNNNIEPYASLNCFEERNYDLVGCYEIGCNHFRECLRIFIDGKYVIKKDL